MWHTDTQTHDDGYYPRRASSARVKTALTQQSTITMHCTHMKHCMAWRWSNSMWICFVLALGALGCSPFSPLGNTGLPVVPYPRLYRSCCRDATVRGEIRTCVLSHRSHACYRYAILRPDKSQPNIVWHNIQIILPLWHSTKRRVEVMRPWNLSVSIHIQRAWWEPITNNIYQSIKVFLE